MTGNSLRRVLLGAVSSTAICSVCSISFAQDGSEIAVPVADATAQTVARPNINPFDRDVAMTVPLNFNSRVLGELDVLLTRDDQFFVYSKSFQALIDPLLTDAARQDLEAALAGRESFDAERVTTQGIRLEYDPTLLAVMVLRIDPEKRAIESLYQGGRREEPGDTPEAFSAYVNTTINTVYRHDSSELVKPSLFLNGAIRMAGVVLEADFQGQERLSGESYGFDRRYARLVYDDPKAFRRWWAGDIDPEIRGRQAFAQMGGIGVARQRQRFDTFRNTVLSGNRQMVLQENSTVRVLRNGMFMREFQLEAGRYDLNNLPLETGSNEIQLEIRDQAGRIQNLNYSAYLDAIDLDPGDYEYGAFLGVLNTSFIGSPDYSDGPLVFTSYWRKAFEDRPALGIGFQASEEVQSVNGQTQFFLPKGARLRLDGAVSYAEERDAGFVAAVAFDHFFDRGTQYDSYTLSAEYTSENYATITNARSRNQTEWAFQGSYTRRFNERWSASISGSYRVSRDDVIGNSVNAHAFTVYNFNPNWGVQFGLEYSDFGTREGTQFDGLGFNLAIIWTPQYDRRGEVRYQSVRNSGSLYFQQSSENRVNSWGYSVAATYDDGPSNVTGQINYIGNRFDGALSHYAFGEDLSSVSDRQMTSLNVGTSFAYTGGRAAIGRRIYDSFAIVRSHESLKGRDVIVGDNLEGGRYSARSGALGPAVANYLSSYVNQSLRYDVIDVPPGYDIGDGIKRVHPAYRSGYVVTAGSDAYVSALGRLVGLNDIPASLMSGRILHLDETDVSPEVFFTNSVGRFAIQKLKPGRKYRVELFSNPPRSFEFTVPEDNEGLYDLQKVSLPIYITEQ